MIKSNKVMVFIDGSNIFMECKRLDIKIKYEKFVKVLKDNKNVMRIFYYSGVDEPISEGQKRFFKMLDHIGIEAIKTPLKVRDTHCKHCKKKTTIKIEKGIDASLATDMLWYAAQGSYDIAVLVSGDGDYIPPVDRVRLLGKRVEIWSFKNSLSPGLKDLADKVVYIDDILGKITFD